MRKALRHFRQALEEGRDSEASWDTMLSVYAREFPEHAQELSEVMEGILPAGWEAAIPAFPADPKGFSHMFLLRLFRLESRLNEFLSSLLHETIM